MYFLGDLLAAGHSADDKAGAIGRVATYEDVLGVFLMLWLQESHGQQNEFGLDDFGLTFLYHDGATALRVWLPVDFLNFHACQLAILTQELQGVDVPSPGTSFLMRRGGLEGARPVGPGILRVIRTFDGLRHNLNLSNALTTLAMSRADAIGTGVTTANHKHILALGRYAIVLVKLDTSQHTILLREQLEGEVNTLQLSAGSLEVTGGGGTCGDDDGVKSLPKPLQRRGC